MVYNQKQIMDHLKSAKAMLKADGLPLIRQKLSNGAAEVFVEVTPKTNIKTVAVKAMELLIEQVGQKWWRIGYDADQITYGDLVLASNPKEAKAKIVEKWKDQGTALSNFDDPEVVDFAPTLT